MAQDLPSGEHPAWGSNGDSAYNFQGQAYNPDTGGARRETGNAPRGPDSVANAGVRWMANYSLGLAYAGIGFRLSR